MTETTVNPLQAQVQATRTIIEGLVAKANAAATAVRSVQNEKSAVSDLIKESDDAIVVKYREEREKLEATLLKWEQEVTAHVKANLLPKDDSVNVEEKTAEYKEAKEAVKGMLGALKIIGGEDAVKDLPEMLTLGRGGSTNVGQTGIKRPRVDRIRFRDQSVENYTEAVHKTEKDGEEKTTVSFSVLSQMIKSQFGEKVDANTLREHAEGVAGEYDKWADRNGDPFEFVVSVGDENNRKHIVVEVTPQS